MATLSSFLFLLVLVYSIIASQNGFMTLNNVAEARALDVIPYGVEVKASSDLLGRFELRKAVLRRKTGRSATPPPMANNPVHMFIPPAKPFHRPPPPPPPLPPATLGLSPPPPLPLSPPPPPPLSLSPPPPPCIS